MLFFGVSGGGTILGGGIAVDSSDNVYVADRFNSRLRKITVSIPRVDTVIQYFACRFNDLCGSFTTLPQTSYNGNVNGVATQTILNNPTQIFIDKSGNIIFSDRNALKIKKINKITRVITTLAGARNPGSPCALPTDVCGDGAVATSNTVLFNNPHGIAEDNKGNLYIADRSDNRIRKVDRDTNIITTVVGTGTVCANPLNPCGDGGQATASNLFLPTAIAFDSNNDMYIADRDNNRVRKIDHLTNIITTVAGNGTSGFSGDGGQATAAGIFQPYAITFDKDDNMYIADRTNKRVRKVTKTTQIITTVVGNGSTCTPTGGPGPYCGDGGQATDAQLNEPSNVAIDFAGNLYVLDKIARMVRKINTNTGIISTIVGDGIQGYSGDGGPSSLARIRDPYGLAIDSNGYIYIGDSGNNVIRMIK